MGSALLDNNTDSTHAEVPRQASAHSAAAVARLGDREARASAGAPGPSAETLRLEVAERLAEHRSRRALAHPQATIPSLQLPTPPGNRRAQRIAAAVAERYAHVPSYRELLAAEAERALSQARAEAEVTALSAQAVAAAQKNLLDALAEADEATAAPISEPAAGSGSAQPSQLPHRLEHGTPRESAPNAAAESRGPFPNSLWPELDAAKNALVSPRASSRKFQPPGSPAAAKRSTVKSARDRDASPSLPSSTAYPTGESEFHALPAGSGPVAGLTVRLYEDSTGATRVVFGPPPTPATTVQTRQSETRADVETMALDEEIAFRQSPVFEESVGPPMPLPVNLIEFPRQLVASRKARPRLAEGPLRDGDDTPEPGQLRIFEVDPTHISTSPAAEADDAVITAAQWTSIWLDSVPRRAPTGAPAREGSATAAEFAADHAESGRRTRPLPQAATIGRRITAAAINAAILFAAVVAFAASFVFVAGYFGAAAPFTLAHGASYAAQAGLAPAQLRAACAVAVAFLYLLYQALFFSFSVATPGMRCASIALCTFDDENPTRAATRCRVLAVLLSACPLGLGLLWAALDEDRLSWHDRICRIYQRSY